MGTACVCGPWVCVPFVPEMVPNGRGAQACRATEQLSQKPLRDTGQQAPPGLALMVGWPRQCVVVHWQPVSSSPRARHKSPEPVSRRTCPCGPPTGCAWSWDALPCRGSWGTAVWASCCMRGVWYSSAQRARPGTGKHGQERRRHRKGQSRRPEDQEPRARNLVRRKSPEPRTNNKQHATSCHSSRKGASVGGRAATNFFLALHVLFFRGAGRAAGRRDRGWARAGTDQNRGGGGAGCMTGRALHLAMIEQCPVISP